MPVPQLLRQDVDEAHAVEDRALIERVGAEEAVDVVGPQVRDHLRRRHGADLHIGVGVEPMLREIVAQQVVVHREVEGHRELEALPRLRIALVLVLHGERDRLAVDVLHRRHRVGDRVRADAKRDRERHRREHVRRVVFLVQRLVADDRPAGRLDDLNVQPVLLIEAERMRHDDRRGAGDRDEADLQVLLLDRPALGEGIDCGRDRQDGRNHCGGRRGANALQQRTALGVVRKGRHHDGPLDDPLVERLAVAGRLGDRVILLRRMAPADAPAQETRRGLERLADKAHRLLSHLRDGEQAICQEMGAAPARLPSRHARNVGNLHMHSAE